MTALFQFRDLLVELARWSRVAERNGDLHARIASALARFESGLESSAAADAVGERQGRQPAQKIALLPLLRKKGQFIPSGFRDEDGVWHEGPHSAEYATALSRIELALREAYRRKVPDTDRWFCQVCRKIGGHTLSCPASMYDLGLGE
jgi:hypothetical protein